jgi:hypothetical protein
MIDRTQGKPVAIDVLRSGDRETVTVQARAEDGRYRMGVELEPRHLRVELPFWQSAKRAARFPVEYSSELFASIARSFKGSLRAEMVGPVGIVKRARRTEPSLDLVFSLPAIGAVWVSWLGLPLGLLLLWLGRAREGRA